MELQKSQLNLLWHKGDKLFHNLQFTDIWILHYPDSDVILLHFSECNHLFQLQKRHSALISSLDYVSISTCIWLPCDLDRYCKSTFVQGVLVDHCTGTGGVQYHLSSGDVFPYGTSIYCKGGSWLSVHLHTRELWIILMYYRCIRFITPEED